MFAVELAQIMLSVFAHWWVAVAFALPQALVVFLADNLTEKAFDRIIPVNKREKPLKNEVDTLGFTKSRLV